MTVERIYLREGDCGPMLQRLRVAVVAGHGIEGDRYFGRQDEPGQNITLVEAEAHRNVPQDRKGSGHEIRFAKPGTWQENLTPEEVAAMEAVLGDRLVADGYA